MKEYTKPALIDNPQTPPTPNSLARLSEYQPNTRWTPGDPLPKNQRPDALEALRRNADAYERHQREEHFADRRAA
jgi:hypothetical protein